jgi:hypothetical protein
VARKQKERPAEEPKAARWAVHAMGLVFLLTQLAILPGSASPFRAPKQSLVLAGMLVVVALGVIGAVRRRGLEVSRGSLTLVLAALPVLQLVSAIWSLDPNRAVQSALHSAVWVIAILWMSGLDDRDRHRLVIWCAVGAGVSAALLLVQATGIEAIDLFRAYGRHRLTGFAGNPVDVSLAGMLLIPLLLMPRPEAGRSRWRWPLIALLALTPVVSQTLTGIAALATLSAAWLLVNRSRKVLAAVAAAVVVVLAIASATGLGDRLQRGVRQIQTGNWYALLSARGDGWSAAGQMVVTRPVQGVGAGNYTHDFYPSRLAWLEARHAVGRRGESATHFEWTHCDPLQHLAELGVVGGLWMVALGWALARTWHTSPALVGMAAATTLPFLLMQYPTHLAVGMMPIALILSLLVGGEKRLAVNVERSGIRVAIAVLLIGLAIAGCRWQLRALVLDGWQADLERQLAMTQRATDRTQRSQAATAIEFLVLSRIDRLPGAAPWLWRIVGKARLLRGDAKGADSAFRTAASMWPHEEADFGLGLALAAQGRRSEALIHLGRVCRVNPELGKQIADPELRRAVTDLTSARRGR